MRASEPQMWMRVYPGTTSWVAPQRGQQSYRADGRMDE